MPNCVHSQARQGGMTLIEVLVSLLIFSFGFLGLIGMQARALQISTDAEDRGRAALLANDIVSAMWLQHSTSLAQPTIDAWLARVGDQSASGLPYSQGAVSTPDSNKMVKVTVSWQAPSRTGTATVSKYETQVLLP